MHSVKFPFTLTVLYIFLFHIFRLPHL